MLHPLVKLVYLVAAAALLYYVFPYFTPFLLALVLAVLVEPVVLWLEDWLRLKRITAVTINFFGFLIITSGLAVLGSTKIINQAVALMRQIPVYIDKVGRGIEGLILQTHSYIRYMPTETVRGVEEAIRQSVSLGNKIDTGTAALMGTAKAIPEFFVIAIVVLVSFYLFSLHLHELKTSFLQLFSERAREKVDIIILDINHAIVGFARAQLIISLLTYFLILAGLMALGVRFALATALLIVLVDILPVFGTGFVMLPWAAFLFIINEKFTAVGIVVLYVLIIVFRRIIEPKILGKNIGLSALATVISMYVGYKAFGIVGFFAGPALCIVFKAMRKAGLFKHRIDF